MEQGVAPPEVRADGAAAPGARATAATIVAVPLLVAIVATIVRGDLDDGAVQLLGALAAGCLAGPPAWALAARVPLRHVLLPGAALIGAAGLGAGVLGALWWLRLAGEVGTYAEAAWFWIGIGLVSGAAGAGCLLAADVSLRVLRHRATDRPPNAFDRWLVGSPERFVAFALLVLPSVAGLVVGWLFLTGDSDAGGSWATSSAYAAAATTLGSLLVASWVVEVGLLGWADVRRIVGWGSIVWALVLGWPRLPAVAWPIVSFLWLLGLCRGRSVRAG